MPILDWEKGGEVEIKGIGSVAHPAVVAITVEGKPRGAFMSCKDQIQDRLCEFFCGNISLYGGQYTAAGEFGLDYIRLAFGAPPAGSSMDNSIRLINEIEKEMRISPSIVKPIKGTKALYVRGSQRWLRSPVLTSMYVMLLRASLYYDGSGWKKWLRKQVALIPETYTYGGATPHQLSHESGYLGKSLPYVEMIVESKGNVFPLNRKKAWEAVKGVSHNNSGIYSFSSHSCYAPLASEATLKKLGFKLVPKHLDTYDYSTSPPKKTQKEIFTIERLPEKPKRAPRKRLAAAAS